RRCERRLGPARRRRGRPRPRQGSRPHPLTARQGGAAMPTWSWIVIVVAVIVIVAVIVTRVAHQRRTAALRDRFGEEYERTVEHAGGIRAAEHELLERERLHDGLELHPLSEVTRSRYLARWSEIQATFVDEPKEAVEEADG